MNNTSTFASKFILGALALVTLVALYTSFNHLSDVLQFLGRSQLDAHLLALAVDTFVVASLLGVWKTPGTTPRVVLVIAIVFTGSLNSYGGYIDHGVSGALFALIPVFLVEAAYWYLRHLTKAPSDTQMVSTSTIPTPADEFGEITADFDAEDEIRPVPQDHTIDIEAMTNEDIKAKMDELDEELKDRAQEFIHDNPKATVRDLARHFKRSQSWARNRMSVSA